MKYLISVIVFLLFVFILSQGLNATQEVSETSEGRKAIKGIVWNIIGIWMLVFGAFAIIKFGKISRER